MESTLENTDKTAIRSKVIPLCYVPADNPKGFREYQAILTVCVSILQGDAPIQVTGCGINHARFKTLDEVHATFCAFLAPIRLDYGACDMVAECLGELGFQRPSGYFS